MVSSEMGSRPLAVILTVRRAVFIWGETEAMVPWTIVPIEEEKRVSSVRINKNKCDEKSDNGPCSWSCRLALRTDRAMYAKAWEVRGGGGKAAARTIFQFNSHRLVRALH